MVRVEDDDFALPSEHPVPTWAVPALAPDEHQTRVAFSAFALADGSHRTVVDPWLANDFPRQAPDAAERADRLLGQLAEVGFAPDQVDTVVNTHFDGVGWNTRPADPGPSDQPTWRASFPRARYLYPRAELEAWRDGQFPTGADAFALLEAEGRLDPIDQVDEPIAISPHVRLEDAPGHAAGHVSVVIESGGELAVIPGHLFLNVFQVDDPTQATDADPSVATDTRRRLLDQLADRRGLLLTTLIGGPGGGAVVRHGDGFALDPAALDRLAIDT